MDNSYKFFSNRKCIYFPCHKAIKEDDFNCLFCYCPLYLLEKCVGTPTYIGNKIKDCSNCLVPHRPENYELIVKTLSESVFDIE
ncbi:MAG: cysteine-rich small domain-containing protein [Lachnospirales bacterium]